MPRTTYTYEDVANAVEASRSFAEVLVRLGRAVNGGNHRTITQKIRYFGLSTNHFTGQAWSRGKTKETSESVNCVARFNRRPDHEVFCENSFFSGTGIRRRLLELDWPQKCLICGLTDWLGAPISLHVDHINGVHNDHRLENLRILCPNCHQQTATWGKRGPSCLTQQKCADCGRHISKTASRCKSCAARRQPTKIQWPDDAELLRLVDDTNVLRVSKALGVSDNAVRKRVIRIRQK